MTSTMTHTPINGILDYESEFVNHLAVKDSLEYILREGVSSEVLISPQSKSVFQFVQHHFSDTGKLAGIRVLNTEFPNLTFDPPETTIQWVVDGLRNRYRKGQITDLTFKLAELHEQPDQAMDFLRSKVFEVEKNSVSNRNISTTGDHKLFLRDLQKQVLEGHFQGASIGFSDMDKFTGGVKAGDLAYILARPKRKKTFFTLMAFIEHILSDEEPYLFTLENTKREIELRMSCMLSGYPWDLAQKGVYMTNDWKKLEKGWERLSNHKYWIEQPPLDERTIPQLLLKADKVEARSIFISQFKYINGLKDFYRTETEERAEVAVDLKRAATRPGKERPIIVEAQFNRGGDSMEELEDFDPSKVGLTDMIPQSADTLYGLFENKDMRSRNVMEFGILEARNHDKAAWYIETELRSRTEFRMVPASEH